MTTRKVRCEESSVYCDKPAIVGLSFGKPKWSFQIDHFCADHLPGAVARLHAISVKVFEQSHLNALHGATEPEPVSVWPLMPDLPEYSRPSERQTC